MSRQFGIEFARLEARVRELEQTRTFANVAIDGGTLPVYDVDGTIRQTIGQQDDGTYTTVDLNAPPPPVPSTPTLVASLGGVVFVWDGKTATGEAWPHDFWHVEAHLSTGPEFVPTDDTQVGSLSSLRGGSLSVAGLDNVAHYGKFVAVNTSREESAPSAEDTATPEAVVSDASLQAIQEEVDAATYAANNITATQITDEAIKTRHFTAKSIEAGTLAVGAVIAGDIASLAVTTDTIDVNAVRAMHIDVGAVQASHIQVGVYGANRLPNGNMEEAHPDLPQPYGWDGAYEQPIGSVALSTETADPIAGTQSLSVFVAAACTSTGLIFSEKIPVAPGEKWFVTAKVRAEVAADSGFILRLHTSNGLSDPIAVFDPNVTWLHAYDGALDAGERTYTGIVTIPDGHTEARVGLALPNGTVDRTATVDIVEAYPAVTSEHITEIQPGKITTGELAAGVRVIAGVDGASRVELTGAGMSGYAIDGVTRTLGFDTATGHLTAESAEISGVFSTGSTGPRIRIANVVNAFESGQNWNVLETHTGEEGWGPGGLWGLYNSTTDEAFLQMSAPTKVGAAAEAAVLRLFTGAANQRRMQWITNAIDWTTVNGGSADIRLFNSNNFQVIQGFGVHRINLNLAPDGFTGPSIEARGDAGVRADFRLRGDRFHFDGDGVDAWLSGTMQTGTPYHYFHDHRAGTYGLAYGVHPAGGATNNGGDIGTFRVTTMFDSGVYKSIWASAFSVNSDPRGKDNVEPLTGALEKVRKVKAYRYRTKVPQHVLDKIEDPKERADMAAGRSGVRVGLMSPEVAAAIPEAVQVDEYGSDMVSLYDLVATGFGATQELDTEVAALRQEVADLRALVGSTRR